jgi:hypothetical protein
MIKIWNDIERNLVSYVGLVSPRSIWGSGAAPP